MAHQASLEGGVGRKGALEEGGGMSPPSVISILTVRCVASVRQLRGGRGVGGSYTGHACVTAGARLAEGVWQGSQRFERACAAHCMVIP